MCCSIHSIGKILQLINFLFIGGIVVIVALSLAASIMMMQNSEDISNDIIALEDQLYENPAYILDSWSKKPFIGLEMVASSEDCPSSHPDPFEFITTGETTNVLDGVRYCGKRGGSTISDQGEFLGS